MMRATPDSPRMFESDIVDFFSRTHPAIVPLLFVPASAGLAWYSVARVELSAGTTASLYVLGLVTWSLTEYWLHRSFFHWLPQFSWGERMHFLVHGVHHKWPRDKYRLVMPPAVSLSLFFLFLGLFWLLLGSRWVFAFHAGFTFGYMLYDMTHYWVHHSAAKSDYGRRLKKHHMLHHFKDPTNRFGVSSMVWDHVFGTQGESERAG
jgi:sterol desaturase/sphingolipid hydroxylase (fatty acid hydroxylase superfamily)